MWKQSMGRLSRHRQTKGPETDSRAYTTAPHPDSTPSNHDGGLAGQIVHLFDGHEMPSRDATGSVWVELDQMLVQRKNYQYIQIHLLPRIPVKPSTTIQNPPATTCPRINPRKNQRVMR